MLFSPRLTLCGIVVVLMATLTFLGRADAGLDKGLCRPDESRGAVPDDFFIDACFDGTTLELHNQSKLVLHVDARGDVGYPTRTEVDLDLAADAARLTSHDAWVLFPGDVLHVPVGAGRARFTVSHARRDDERYGLGRELEAVLPAKSSKAAAAAGKINLFAALINELATDYEQYSTCLADANWFMQLGCRSLLVRNVGSAYARFGVKLGVKGVGVLLSRAEFLAFAYARVKDATELKKHRVPLVLRERATPEAPRPHRTEPPTRDPGTTREPAPSHNGAGGTTCNEFRSLSGDGQTSVIRAMMSEMHLETDRTDVLITLASTKAFCTVKPGNRTINGIYHG